MLFNITSSTTQSSSISVVLPSDSSISSSTSSVVKSSSESLLQPQSRNGTLISSTSKSSSASSLSAVNSFKKVSTSTSSSLSSFTTKSTTLLSSSEETLVVSPSTVWIPNVSSTDSSEHNTVTEETQMVTIVEESSTITTIGSTITSTLYPAQSTDQDHPTPSGADTATYDASPTDTAEVETTPTWLLPTTAIPSSETLVFYTRDYIFTDTSTTFTKKLPTLTVLPTQSSFTKPTSPVVTDTSYYQRWLSGGLDSNPKSTSSNKDSIIGGVVGCVGGLFVMLVIIYFLYKKRRKRNLLAHEKSFSHEVGRKMGYDDIDKFIVQSRVSSDSVTQLSPAAHKTYQSTKALPSTPTNAPILPKRSEADNPFNDEYLISNGDVGNPPQHSTSVHSSMLTSSSGSTEDGGDTLTSTTFTESIRNSNGYLTEIIES